MMWATSAVLATLPFGSGTTTVPAVFRHGTIEDEPYQIFPLQGRFLRESVLKRLIPFLRSASTNQPIQNPLAKAEKIWCR